MWVISDQRWPVHSAAHLAEHRYDEALVAQELASTPLSLLCCYDAAGSAPSLLDAAREVHPRLRLPGGQSEPNPSYRSVDPAGLLGEELQPAPPDAATLAVGASQVPTRRFVTNHATTAGLDQHRIEDAALAVDELATNTAMHGGGHGILRAWTDREWLVYEITDHGHITDPLVGRRRPSPHQIGGRGLWIVNQLSDLFQLRSHDATTTARVYFQRSSTSDETTPTAQSR
jgi:anti-sigma regulatory factor (Ser/Thr protein kinase)